jgi:hypothetical protein
MIMRQGLETKWALAVGHFREHALAFPETLAAIDAFLDAEIKRARFR